MPIKHRLIIRLEENKLFVHVCQVLFNRELTLFINFDLLKYFLNMVLHEYAKLARRIFIIHIRKIQLNVAKSVLQFIIVILYVKVSDIN
jgi:hypothetical protein